MLTTQQILNNENGNFNKFKGHYNNCEKYGHKRADYHKPIATKSKKSNN